jgi:adenosylcobinamide-phosphate synthase
LFDKPYIGENARELTTADMQKAVRINRIAEVLAVIIVMIIACL